MARKPRILIGKVGLDGHDVGARVISRALADAGMEVIYTGLRQKPDQIVSTAIEESVDVIGISILSNSHMALFQDIVRLLKNHNASGIPFIAGGIIPAEDVPVLKKMGVREIFPPETPTYKIIDFINSIVNTD